jgi:hypothetical protein
LILLVQRFFVKLTSFANSEIEPIRRAMMPEEKAGKLLAVPSGS